MTNARDRRWSPESSEASEASESADADADGSSSERTDSDADGSSSPLLLCGGEAEVSEIPKRPVRAVQTSQRQGGANIPICDFSYGRDNRDNHDNVKSCVFEVVLNSLRVSVP